MTDTKVAHLLKMELVRMLSETLGQEMAEEAVTTTAARLGYRGLEYDRTQALAILEALALTPGIVGVVARFAKARIILSFRPSDAPASPRHDHPSSPPSSRRSTPPPKPLAWPEDPLDPKKR